MVRNFRNIDEGEQLTNDGDIVTITEKVDDWMVRGELHLSGDVTHEVTIRENHMDSWEVNE